MGHEAQSIVYWPYIIFCDQKPRLNEKMQHGNKMYQHILGIDELEFWLIVDLFLPSSLEFLAHYRHLFQSIRKQSIHWPVQWWIFQKHHRGPCYSLHRLFLDHIGPRSLCMIASLIDLQNSFQERNQRNMIEPHGNLFCHVIANLLSFLSSKCHPCLGTADWIACHLQYNQGHQFQQYCCSDQMKRNILDRSDIHLSKRFQKYFT